MTKVRWSLVALDCPDPSALARFYADLVGWEVGDDDGRWVELRSAHGATIAFQRVEGYQPPRWPSTEHPQQAHLDFEVDDLDVGEAHALAIGARKAAVQPGTTFRVYLDIADHPFCLVLASADARP